MVSPTDAQLALCSAGAYGEKEGEGALRDMLPAQIELDKLSKRWNVPTGCVSITTMSESVTVDAAVFVVGLGLRLVAMQLLI